MADGLNETQKSQVEDKAELVTRRFFNEYLNKTFPQQLEKIHAETNQLITMHNMHPKAHGGVEAKLNRFSWTLMGLLSAGGGGLGFLIKTLTG